MIPHSPIIFTDLQPAPRKARARRTEPAESHDAANRVERSGKTEKQRFMIYGALKVFGPQTCREIATTLRKHFATYAEPHEVGKRINEVEGIAPTGESRNGARVWALL
jgi:hypothetical protein